MGETLRLKVKEGTQADTKVRLKGKGMPVYKKETERGDLIVTFTIAIPTTLTAEQRGLVVQLKELGV